MVVRHWKLLLVLLGLCYAGPLSPTKSRAAFDGYVESAQRTPLQAGCVPRRFEAQGTYRGTALLFHGYSACPQQFLDLAPLLAARGFDVFLPLTPGHGNALRENVPGRCIPMLESQCAGPLDDTQGLPEDMSGYFDFVQRMNDILVLAEGDRVVSGLSLGGSLAAWAGESKSPSGEPLYVRRLILNPLIRLSGNSEWQLRLANTLPLVREMYMGWGAGCRLERSFGRAGICTFKASQSAAAHDFGVEILQRVQRSTMVLKGMTSILYDRGDPVVDTAEIRKLSAAYRSRSQALNSCTLPFTMHSMLSKWDDHGQAKWWIPELDCKLADFLTGGADFALGGGVESTEADEPLCALKCADNTTCPYVPSAPILCGVVAAKESRLII